MKNIIECSGRVVGFEEGRALVAVESASACGGCGSRGSCASASKAVRVVRLQLRAGAKVGDRVSLAMASSSVALAALLGYLLPPSGMLAGAVAGAHYVGGDAAAVLGAGLGLFAGLLAARLISRFAFRGALTPAVCGPASHLGVLR